MKIRNGFVSNSSSSSFVIRTGDSLEEIATSMLNTVIEDYGDWDENEYKTQKATQKKRYVIWRKNLKAALKRDDVLEGKIGITMPSCNYDTYIIQKDGVIYITTANNHQWDIGAKDIEYDESGDSEELQKVMQASFFFSVRNKMIHSRERYDMKEDRVCPECKKQNFSYVENQKNEQICGLCYKGILGKTNKQIEEEAAKELQEKRNQLNNPITSLEID